MRKILILATIILSSINLFADGKMSEEYECCVRTNLKLQEQIDNQSKIIKALTDIEKSILLNNDTLKHTIKLELDNISSKVEPEEKGCNLCSIIGAIIGAVLSGGIAIFIFWRSRQNEKQKDKAKLIDFGEEVYSLVKNIVVNSNKQISLLKELTNSINEKPYSHGEYHRVSFNLLKRAQSFDTSYTFNTFKTLKLEKKSYIKFYNSIDFILELFVNIDSDYNNKNHEVVTPLSNEFIGQKEKIFTICTDFIEKKRKENDTTGDFYSFINQLVIDYYTSEELPETIDLEYDVENLIRPLKIELLSKYRDEDLTNGLLTLAKRAGDLYQTIVIENKYFASGVSGQIENIENSIVNLEEIQNELSNFYKS